MADVIQPFPMIGYKVLGKNSIVKLRKIFSLCELNDTYNYEDNIMTMQLEDNKQLGIFFDIEQNLSMIFKITHAELIDLSPNGQSLKKSIQGKTHLIADTFYWLDAVRNSTCFDIVVIMACSKLTHSYR